MRIPHAERCFAKKEKICSYLLSLSHPVGGSKARFFRSFGFTPEDWETFAAALSEIPRLNELLEREETTFGTRFVIDGILQSPDRRNPRIRTVWFIERDMEIPHLVTAHPLPAPKEVKNDP